VPPGGVATPPGVFWAALLVWTEVSASGGLWAWEAGAHDRALPRFGVDLKPAVDRCHAVGETAQAGAAVEVRAAHAVVPDLDREPSVSLGQSHRGLHRRGVLGCVGQRFGDDEVRGQLDLLGEPSVGQGADDLDRQRSPRGERLDSGAETAFP